MIGESVADNPSSAAPTIAFIGTEGSGKTVLITTLAKQFGRASDNGVFLNPLNNNTIRYVERNWQTLCSEEWPAGSPLGQMFDLQWHLVAGGDAPVDCELRVVDAAGQDLRRLFSDDDPTTVENHPSHLQKLKEYCNSADIVVCLVNLADFVGGEVDPVRGIDNEIVIKSALQQLGANPARRLCVAFTQVDRYEEELKRYKTWSRVAEKRLPYVSMHLRYGLVRLEAVAAVKGTTVKVRADGRADRVPAREFRSVNLDRLMTWLVKEARAIVAERLAEQRRRKELATKSIEEDRLKRLEYEQKKKMEEEKRQEELIGNVAFGVIFVLALCLLWWWTSPPASKSLRVMPYSENTFWPKPELSGRIDYGRFHDDISVSNGSTSDVKDLKLRLKVFRKDDPWQLKPVREETLNVFLLPKNDTYTWRNIVSVSGKDELTLEVIYYDW